MPLASKLRGAGPGLWLVLGQLAFLASGYVVNVVGGRVLGPADYGLLGIVLVLTTATHIIQGQGVPQALSRAVAGHPEDEADLYRTAARLQRAGTVIVALSVLALAPVLAALLDEPELQELVMLASVTAVGQSLLLLQIGFANGRRAFRRQGLMLVLYSAARVVAVPLATVAAGVAGAVLAWGVAPLVVAAWAYRDPTWRPPGTARPGLSRPLVRFAVPSVLLAGSVSLLMMVDLPVVRGAVDDAAASGLYAAAANVARIAYFLVLPLGLALFPTVARTAKDSLGLAATASWGLEVAIAAAAVLVAVIVALRDAILEIAYGTAYVAAGDIVLRLAPAVGLIAVASVLASAVAATGRPWLALTAPGAGLALQAVLLVPLARADGTDGAATATLAGGSLALAIALVLAWWRLGARLSLLRLLAQAAAAAVAFGIAHLGATPLLALPAGALACVAALAVLRVLGALPPAQPPLPAGA